MIDLARGLDENTGAFVETAAVLRNLDLLITSDTSIAHVAGDWGFLCGWPSATCPIALGPLGRYDRLVSNDAAISANGSG